MPIESHGFGVFSFDDWDEGMEFMRKKEDEANARVTDWQRKLRPGDLVFTIADIGRPMLAIAKTVTPEQHYTETAAKYGEEDARYEADSIAERFTRGYLYGKWFSEIEKQGSWEDAHISTLGPRVPASLFRIWMTEILSDRNPLEFFK